DINQLWSAMLCSIPGKGLRAFFCEVAGAQAMLHAHDPSWPDTGMTIPCELCGGSGEIEAYKGEPSQGTTLVRCDACDGLPWWRQGMNRFAEQVEYHCHRCGVP